MRAQSSHDIDVPWSLNLTAGPTRVPDRVLLAGARSLLQHRSAAFSQVLERVMTGLRHLFGTEHHVFVLASSSRGGLEAALANLLEPGDSVLNVANGHFAQQWGSGARHLGHTVHDVCTDWSVPADPGDVQRALQQHPEVRLVTVVHSETSTGILNPVAEIAAVAREEGRYVAVDAVSSLGGLPLAMDAWNVDIMVSGPQKCLMAPPGLSLIACSRRALKRAKSTRAAGMPPYLSLARLAEFAERDAPQTPFTTPVTVVLSLAESLEMIDAFGVGAFFDMHRHRAAAVRNVAVSTGISLYARDEHVSPEYRSPALTTIVLPDESELEQVVATLRRRYGVLVGRGLGKLANRTFRVGHLGAITRQELKLGLHAVTDVLSARGHVPTIAPGTIDVAIEQEWPSS